MTTSVMCAERVTEGFEVKVGLHQGSALSPCLFVTVIDRMSNEIMDHDVRDEIMDHDVCR